jgi:hypothetical protein
MDIPEIEHTINTSEIYFVKIHQGWEKQAIFWTKFPSQLLCLINQYVDL